MCLHDGQPIGYAVYFYSYSTWLGRNGVYLEDLYITPEKRSIGAGRALLRHIAREAVANDCGRLSGACWTGTSQPSSSTKRSALRRKVNGFATGWRVPGCWTSPKAAIEAQRPDTKTPGLWGRAFKKAFNSGQQTPGGMPSLLKSFRRSFSSGVECAGTSLCGSGFSRLSCQSWSLTPLVNTQIRPRAEHSVQTDCTVRR